VPASVERMAESRQERRAAATVEVAGRPYGRRRTDGEPKVGWAPTLAVMLAVVFADWSTKLAVASTIPVGTLVEVWEGRLALWHVRNPEMVLGLWGNVPLASRQAIAATAGLAGILILFEIVGRGHRLPPHRRPWVWLFVGLAFGGMLGNLGERALHWTVTDFLSIGFGPFWLPPGNIADLAMITAIALAVPVIVFELQARRLRGTYRARDTHPRLRSEPDLTS
jgi:lipoprotein signal peptidase